MRSIPTRTDRAAPAGARLRSPAWGALAVTAGLAAAFPGAGCSSGVAPPLGQRREVAPVRGGVLRTAFFTDVRSLDAATAFDTASSAIEDLIYDRLVTYDAEGALTPQLAERWDVSPDGKRYTFALRRGALFHDGTELTAADVKRSIERALHVKTPCPVPSYYERIAGYAAWHDGKAPELTGVRADGAYSLVIELREPDSTFLHLMALPIVAPLCASAGSTYDREFSTRPCGAGPFEVVEYTNGQIIRLKRHEGYWQKGLPYLDGIEWSLSMAAFTQRFKFERGDLDYMREFGDADSTLYRASPAWQGLGGWESSLTTLGLFMNTELAPFNDRHVRRAVSFALDREQLARVRPGHITPQVRMLPPALQDDDPATPRQSFDPARALEEMRLAGYPFDPTTGRGGYPETIEYLAILDSFSQTAAEIYQQQLARIGIRLRLQIVGWPTFLAKSSRRRTVKMGFTGWHADFPDASTFFEPILTSRAIQDEESQNAAFFAHAELDRVVERARNETDPEARRALFRRAEGILAEEVPWAVTHGYRYFELWHPYVHGYQPHPVLSQAVRGAWIDREGQRLAGALRVGGRPLTALGFAGLGARRGGGRP